LGQLLIDPVIPAFFIAAIIIFIGFFGSVLLNRYNIPDAIFLIALGYLLGPGSKIIFGGSLLEPSYFEPIAPYIGALALVAIMFESSLGIDINELIVTARPALTLSVTSFMLSSIISFCFLYYVLNIAHGDMMIPLLISVIIGGSSGAVVASIANKISMPDNIQLTLSIESILTDVYVIVSALTILTLLRYGGTTGIASVGGFIAQRFSVSLVIGVLSGVFLAHLLHRLRREKHLYTMTFAFLILLYAGTEFLGGSGAISVLTAGILLSNIGILAGIIKNTEMLEIVKFQRYNLEALHSELTLLLRIFFFVEVGLIINLTNIYAIFISVILSILLLVSRLPPSYLAARVLGYDVGRKTATATISVFYARGLAAAVMAVVSKPLVEPYISSILSNPSEIQQIISLIIEIPSAVVLLSNIVLTVGVALLRKRITQLI